MEKNILNYNGFLNEGKSFKGADQTISYDTIVSKNEKYFNSVIAEYKEINNEIYKTVEEIIVVIDKNPTIADIITDMYLNCSYYQTTGEVWSSLIILCNKDEVNSLLDFFEAESFQKIMEVDEIRHKSGVELHFVKDFGW